MDNMRVGNREKIIWERERATESEREFQKRYLREFSCGFSSLPFKRPDTCLKQRHGEWNEICFRVSSELPVANLNHFPKTLFRRRITPSEWQAPNSWSREKFVSLLGSFGIFQSKRMSLSQGRPGRLSLTQVKAHPIRDRDGIQTAFILQKFKTRRES